MPTPQRRAIDEIAEHLAPLIDLVVELCPDEYKAGQEQLPRHPSTYDMTAEELARNALLHNAALLKLCGEALYERFSDATVPIDVSDARDRQSVRPPRRGRERASGLIDRGRHRRSRDAGDGA